MDYLFKANPIRLEHAFRSISLCHASTRMWKPQCGKRSHCLVWSAPWKTLKNKWVFNACHIVAFDRRHEKRCKTNGLTPTPIRSTWFFVCYIMPAAECHASTRMWKPQCGKLSHCRVWSAPWKTVKNQWFSHCRVWSAPWKTVKTQWFFSGFHIVAFDRRHE